jgi:hypothetical protein
MSIEAYRKFHHTKLECKEKLIGIEKLLEVQSHLIDVHLKESLLQLVEELKREL